MSTILRGRLHAGVARGVGNVEMSPEGEDCSCEHEDDAVPQLPASMSPIQIAELAHDV